MKLSPAFDGWTNSLDPILLDNEARTSLVTRGFVKLRGIEVVTAPVNGIVNAEFGSRFKL